MKIWCRVCRKWDYQEHFRQLKPNHGLYSWDGCGQGRDDIRYHPGKALCGDVWKMKDGRYVVIDYIDGMQTGITFSDGEQRGCKYTATLQDMLERDESELISTFEERHFPLADDRGWTPRDAKASDWSKKQSLKFIQYVLDSIAGKFVPSETSYDARRSLPNC